MLNYFEQITAKLIAIIAGLIISLGIVQIPPIIEYQLSVHRVEKQSAESKSIQADPLQSKGLGGETEKLPEIPISKPPIVQPLSTPIITPPQPTISPIELNKTSRSAIVNILCTTESGGPFRPISGSGIVISENGIILTTAHLAQYFLLEDSPDAGHLDCIIRRGDVAEPAYDAKLLYIPPVWVESNAESIIRDEAKGTGENDFAFLMINKSNVIGRDLPAVFDFAAPDFDFENLPKELSVLLAAYPAGFIGGISIQKDLGLTSTFAAIKNLYTFSEEESGNLDIFSLSGNIVAQSGSSGGGIFDTRSGKLIGVIVTSTTGTTTASRELNAITTTHIRRSFEKYAGYNLEEFLKNPGASVSLFPETEFNRLKKLLIDQLEKR